MRLFIFKSHKSNLSAFTAENDSRVLPSQHAPWHAVGVIRPEADPPHNFKREAIEQAIAASGYQLFRLKKKPTA